MIPVEPQNEGIAVDATDVNFEDRTPEGQAEYLVRMTVGETNRCVTGSIDGETALVEIGTFDYPLKEN